MFRYRKTFLVANDSILKPPDSSHYLADISNQIIWELSWYDIVTWQVQRQVR